MAGESTADSSSSHPRRSIISKPPQPPGTASRCINWHRTASSWRISTTISGCRWIRCGTKTILKNCGSAVGRHGASGIDVVHVMNASWWKSRKVFVTGHTGFKGAWLCLLLDRLGAEVHGYSLAAPTEPNLYGLAGAGARVRNTLGDVRYLPSLSAAIRQADAEIGIHMAAQPLVRDSYQDPVGTYATNVMGTVNLLESVRSAGGKVAAV